MNPYEKLLKIDPNTCNLLRRTGLLKPLVKYLIIEQLTANLVPPKEMKEKALNDFCQAKGLINKSKLMAYLKEQYLSYDELLEKISLPLKKQYYSLQKFGSKSKSHFLKRKDALDKVTYSLIRVRNQDVAYDAYLRLEEKKADFISLVHQFSEGPEKNNNGRIGPTSLSNANPIIKELLENKSIGQVHEPVLIDNWWVVARLEERTDSVFDDAMKILMACELFEEWLNNEYHKVIKSLFIKHEYLN
ncbi:MAG: peptidylprolyl isomerase [Prochlorococcus marinus CUG1436]|nr:peptidylprolyl isomerase [Prochlorococcus marinus CUG1436]